MSLSQALNQFAQNLGRYPTARAYAPARNHAEAITSCAYNALHSNNAGDNTNVLIVLHPFGIGIALARHQQLQDAIHILW